MPLRSDAPAAVPAPGAARFPLTRWFSVLALVGIAITTACLLWAYRELALRQLLEHEGRANADLTRSVGNSVWMRHRVFLAMSGPRGRDALLADPAVPAIHADLAAKMHGLRVAKVKLYDLSGVTLYSTDAGQIGESKRDNPGFRAALEGRVVSHLTYRERFDSYEGEIGSRNLISSYVPIRPADGAPIEGVIELYSDVTELHAGQVRAQWQVAALVAGLLGTLYLFLLVVVRKADSIIGRQERERAGNEARIRHQAYHDPLTGLPNRAGFVERLEGTMALARRTGRTCALMFVDLDRFKRVNDTLGHAAGDALLKDVAERIHGCLRASDVLFRMGGDEFTVILPEVAAPEDAERVARRVLAALGPPIAIADRELTVGAAIGIAVWPGDGDTADTLLRHADAAMYAAKAAGGGGHAFYRPDLNRRAAERLALANAARKGLRDGEFAVYWQPRVDAARRRVTSVGAVLRWLSPTHGVLDADAFTGALEEAGAMPAVGEWLLRTACAQLGRRAEAGLDAIRVAVPVSESQFRGGAFVATVRAVLDETGVAHGRLELGVPAAALSGDLERVRGTIAALHAIGVRVSVDGFGGATASLEPLRRLDVDAIGLDAGLVAGVASDRRDRAVVGAAIDLARALGIASVAEGVETDAQALALARAGCDELQGGLVCPPLPAAQLVRWMVASAPRAGHAADAATVGPDAPDAG